MKAKIVYLYFFFIKHFLCENFKLEIGGSEDVKDYRSHIEIETTISIKDLLHWRDFAGDFALSLPI
jgi:hypothetical protein